MILTLNSDFLNITTMLLLVIVDLLTLNEIKNS